MKPPAIAGLLLLALCGACTRYSEPPTSLVGTFRTRAPISSKAGTRPPLFEQYQFSKDGVIAFSLTDESGVRIGPPEEKLRFAFKGRAIEVQPFEPLPASALFCSPNLTYVNEDRLLVDGSPYVLIRAKQ
jgi:hypothetical protein